jgi:hypothetical protein
VKTRPADEYLKTLKKRYAEAGKVDRGKILDEFVATSGYHRKHAIAMLNGRRVRIGYRAKRPRAQIYGKEEVRAVLHQFKAAACGDGCGAETATCSRPSAG